MVVSVRLLIEDRGLSGEECRVLENHEVHQFNPIAASGCSPGSAPRVKTARFYSLEPWAASRFVVVGESSPTRTLERRFGKVPTSR